jgi:alpha-1,2-mannosyltransferase
MYQPRSPSAGPLRPILVVMAAVAALALVVRTVIELNSGGLSGMVGYDQGVYYSASEAVTWGLLPYRDFLFLHPPGVLVALAPVGLVGRLTRDSLGLELSRVLVVLVGSLNAALVAASARRLGWFAAAVAGTFYALWPPVAMAETQPRLEPFVSLGLLVALAVLASRSGRVPRAGLVLAGCALGFAVTVKIWAVVPVLVILAAVLLRLGPRALVRVAAPLVATATVICLPFFAAAPSGMFRMVVHDQLVRGRMTTPLHARLAGMFGLTMHVGQRSGVHAPLVPVLVVVGVGLPLVWVMLPVARLAVVLFLTQAAVLLASPSFFAFYAAYLGPALALCVGAGAVAVARLPHPRRAREPWRGLGVPQTTGALVALVAVAVLASVARTDAFTRVGHSLPVAALRAAVAHARCVTTDSVGSLALLDVLGRDLSHRCPMMMDFSGLTHDRDAAVLADGMQAPRRADLRWQHDVNAYLRSGRVVVLVRRHFDGFDSTINAWLRRSPVLAGTGGYRAYGKPPTSGAGHRSVTGASHTGARHHRSGGVKSS